MADRGPQQPPGSAGCNRAERRKREKLHRSLGLLPMRSLDALSKSAHAEATRDRDAILHQLHPVLFERSDIGACLALEVTLGRVTAMMARNPQHLARLIEGAADNVRLMAEEVFNQCQEI